MRYDTLAGCRRESNRSKWLDLTYDYSTRQAPQDIKTQAFPVIAHVVSGGLVYTQSVLYYNDHDSRVSPPIMSAILLLPAIEFRCDQLHMPRL